MRRWFVRIWTLISLALLLCTVFLWFRSYRAGEEFYRSRWTFHDVPDDPDRVELREFAIWFIYGRGGFAVEVRQQTVPVARERASAAQYPPRSRSRHTTSTPTYPQRGEADTLPRKLGFGFWSSTYGIRYTATNWRVWFPAWPLAFLLAISPTLLLIHWRRARRFARENRCEKCGYDVRESHERCPECGEPVTHISPAPSQ